MVLGMWSLCAAHPRPTAVSQDWPAGAGGRVLRDSTPQCGEGPGVLGAGTGQVGSTGREVVRGCRAGPLSLGGEGL